MVKYAIVTIFARQITERCRSGLTGTPGKRVCVKAYRGFESLPFRKDKKNFFMRIILIIASVLLLFVGVFGSALNHSPVEIRSNETKVDEWNLSYVKGQNLLSIKQIDSLTAYSNQSLVQSLISK